MGADGLRGRGADRGHVRRVVEADRHQGAALPAAAGGRDMRVRLRDAGGDGEAVPGGGHGEVARHAVPGLVELAEIVGGPRQAVGGGAAVPEGGGLGVVRDAVTAVVHHRHAEGGGDHALRRRAPVPARGRARVRGDAVALFIERAEAEGGLRVARVGQARPDGAGGAVAAAGIGPVALRHGRGAGDEGGKRGGEQQHEARPAGDVGGGPGQGGGGGHDEAPRETMMSMSPGWTGAPRGGRCRTGGSGRLDR